ncbi:MAG TPA: DNA polymerase III subunit alpha, partial [Gammaproteobacteria bacterium]|nr:DNA polymerase III subunit alpha [Gammaproteobacteria bacterium]
MIYSSVIRPAANRYINILIDRIHGADWELPHPDLDFLNESYGIMVYEEQVSLMGRVMAGMSYAQSDKFRKVVSRRSKPWQVEEVTGWFFEGAKARGYGQALVQEVWDMVESFEGYSFNKPHSASYAMLSFKCAYLKAHYPAEFLAAVVTNQGGYYSAYAYLSEARRMGIRILLPDINRSGFEYRGAGDRIRMGFIRIQTLRQKSIEALLQERKHGEFASLDDFVQRVSVPFADLRTLIKAGCFDRLEPERSRPELIYAAMEHEYRSAAAGTTARMDGDGTPPSFRKLSPRDKVRMELECFGFPVSEHPLDKYEWYLEGKTIKAGDIPKHVGERVNLAGLNITRKAIRTRRGERMEFLTFEDQTAVFECVLFPDAYEKYNDLVRWEQLFVLQGV